MKKAFKPQDIAVLFLEYVHAQDLDGVVSLFDEHAAVVPSIEGPAIVGRAAIRKFFAEFLESKPKFEGVEHRPPIVNGDIALTSSRSPHGFVTAEVARRQADGSWLWIIDRSAVAIEKP